MFSSQLWNIYFLEIAHINTLRFDAFRCHIWCPKICLWQFDCIRSMLPTSVAILFERIWEKRASREKLNKNTAQSSDVLCIFRDRRHQDIHLLSVIKSPALTQKPARLAPTPDLLFKWLNTYLIISLPLTFWYQTLTQCFSLTAEWKTTLKLL